MGQQVELHWRQGRAWEATTRGFSVIGDSSREFGGTDQGMTPTELLASALGMCIALDISFYAERHPNIDLSQLQLAVTWEKTEKPVRVGAMRVTLRLPDGISDAERDAITRVAGSCVVRRTLEQSVDVQLDVV